MVRDEDAALFDALRRVSTDSVAGVLLKKGLSNQWVRGPVPLRLDFPRTVAAPLPCGSSLCVKTFRCTCQKTSRTAMRGGLPPDASPLPTPAPRDAATFGDIVVTRMASGALRARYRRRRTRSHGSDGLQTSDLDERHHGAASGSPASAACRNPSPAGCCSFPSMIS